MHLVALTGILMLLASAGPVTASPRRPMTSVSIRVYDYARLDARQIRRAQRQVTETYAKAGVRLTWQPLVTPSDDATGRNILASGPAPDLSVIVLTGPMADRLAVAPGVAGYAPITRERGGRVAYVLGARVAPIAKAGGVAPAKVLAGVITHELAHLLLPEQGHSPSGVLRAHWRPSEFGDKHRQRFSAAEAQSMVRRLDAKTVAPLRGAD